MPDPPESRARTATSATARITEQQLFDLGAMLQEPTRYTQRFLEELAFLPRGGQHWTRTLQIAIPPDTRARTARVVSLGTFERRRFPDISVCDADGARLNLLTRAEHGFALSRVLLGAHLTPFESALRKLADSPIGDVGSGTDLEQMRRAYEQLHGLVYTELTGVGDVPDLGAKATSIGEAFQELLEITGVADPVPLVSAFGDALVQLLRTTQYLCWVEATGGDVVNLQVTYTIADGRRELDEPLGPNADNGSGRLKYYRQFGLAPLNYSFRGPGRSHAGSYYFTIEPPPRTTVTWLSCDEPTSLKVGDGELDCALQGVHLHNADQGAAGHAGGSMVRAYLKPDQREHKSVAIAALLNLAFVFLIGRGHLSDKVGASNQTWVLLTPTILTGFLAQQQRHYYALAFRQQRAVLWGYLCVSILFVVAVSFSLARSDSGTGRWGWFVVLTGAVLAASSAFVSVAYAQLGYRYQKTILKWTGDRDWHAYERAVLKYGNRVCASASLATGIAIALFAILWSSGSATTSLHLSNVSVRMAVTRSRGARQAAATFDLNHPAIVTLSVVRQDGGVQVGSRCLALSWIHKRARQGHRREWGWHTRHRGRWYRHRRRTSTRHRPGTKPPCDLLVQQVTRVMPAGTRRIETSQPLHPGSYRLSLTARASETRALRVMEWRVLPPHAGGGN
jgi:hypothetical protein